LRAAKCQDTYSVAPSSLLAASGPITSPGSPKKATRYAALISGFPSHYLNGILEDRMPLSLDNRKNILEYCDRDLPSTEWYLDQFDFIEQDALRKRLALEFYAARYLYKLGEALKVSGAHMHAHVKFQIIQYASIYEAVIVYLLWNRFSEHGAVISIQFHKVFRKAATLPSSLIFTTADSAEIFLCTEQLEKTSTMSIKFADKVDAAVSIGFLDHELGHEIKEFYNLRNALHLETAVKRAIKYEIEQAQLAYWRMQPFIDGIKGYLRSGVLPDVAKIATKSAAND
jgi:hypothetical protein